MKRNTYNVDEELTKKFNLGYLMRLLRYALPFRSAFIISFILILTVVGVSMVRPYLTGYIVDSLIPTANEKVLIWIVLAIAGTCIVEVVCSVIQSILLNKAGYKIVLSMRKDIFRTLQKLDLDFFDSRPSGKIVVRATTYVDEIANFFAVYLVQLFVNILKIVLLTIFIFIYEWHLALVVLCTIVPAFVLVLILRKIIAKRLTLLRSADAGRAAFVAENIAGNDVVKSFNRKEINLDIYMNEVFAVTKKRWISFIRINNLFGPTMEFIWNLGTIAIFAVSFILFGIPTVGLTLGTTVAFLSYAGMYHEPVTWISNAFQQLANVSSYLERIFELLDTDPKIRDKENARTLSDVKGEVAFHNVTFSYDGTVNVLEGFDYTAPAGSSTALVGETGAGKTTVISLINRFYDVTDGSVTIDGTDVRDVTLHSLRKNVGVMLQDSFLFRGTIIDNIRYGTPDATDEQCIAAAKKIHADEMIDRLPNGYYTELSENGTELSQGERQLLSFARIILKDPAVLILDEATSSIDTETEKRVQSALSEILRGRTSFIIAHRLSTIKNCDQILCIGNKGILERGTHKELLEKNGVYAGLVHTK